MVKKGIVLGHLIYDQIIMLDREKLKLIENLPPPISFKGIRSFIGNAVFYIRPIKDFSKSTHLLCKSLENEYKDGFDDDCLREFGESV